RTITSHYPGATVFGSSGMYGKCISILPSATCQMESVHYAVHLIVDTCFRLAFEAFSGIQALPCYPTFAPFLVLSTVHFPSKLNKWTLDTMPGREEPSLRLFFRRRIPPHRVSAKKWTLSGHLFLPP